MAILNRSDGITLILETPGHVGAHAAHTYKTDTTCHNLKFPFNRKVG
jgi:hypothetical protein